MGVVGVALAVGRGGRPSTAKIAIGETFMGVGLAATHVVGLAGVEVSGVRVFRPLPVAAAVLVAVGAAVASGPAAPAPTQPSAASTRVVAAVERASIDEYGPSGTR